MMAFSDGMVNLQLDVPDARRRQYAVKTEETVSEKRSQVNTDSGHRKKSRFRGLIGQVLGVDSGMPAKLRLHHDRFRMVALTGFAAGFRK
jgi:hypothetical protein